VVLHALAHDVGDLVELAVVLFEKSMQNSPLHRLEPVLKVGDRPVPDDVRRIFQKISVEKVFYVSHGYIVPISAGRGNCGGFLGRYCFGQQTTSGKRIDRC